MGKFIDWLVNFQGSTFLSFIGIPIQIVVWLISFPISVAVHQNEVLSTILNILLIPWFYVPLISLGAIFIGILQLKRTSHRVLPIIGIILNIIWFILFAIVWFFVTVIGISV